MLFLLISLEGIELTVEGVPHNNYNIIQYILSSFTGLIVALSYGIPDLSNKSKCAFSGVI